MKPKSPTRAQALRVLPPGYFRDELLYFDGHSEARQDELSASTMSRLNAFVNDDTIRRIFLQRHRTLDLATIIDEHKLLIVNLEQYRPLRPDDVRLLGRFIVNDLLAQAVGAHGERVEDPAAVLPGSTYRMQLHGGFPFAAAAAVAAIAGGLFGGLSSMLTGPTIVVPVSARTKQNLDLLLEMILLVAEIQDLKANPARPAMASVLEAKLDRGRGPAGLPEPLR